MMIIMRTDASKKEIDAVIERVKCSGMQAHVSVGEERTIIGAIGDGRQIYQDQFMLLRGLIGSCRSPALTSWLRASFARTIRFSRWTGFEIGGPGVVIIAGPCSVENRSQLLETAHAVREAGAHALRGGVYKPRTSPYAFQGMGEDGLEFLIEAREQTGLPIVSEVMREEQIPLMAQLCGCPADWRAQYAELCTAARRR